jgi:hypothetical protein
VRVANTSKSTKADTRGVLALLSTCRQIHHEAAPLIYEGCIFDCTNFIRSLESVNLTMLCSRYSEMRNHRCERVRKIKLEYLRYNFNASQYGTVNVGLAMFLEKKFPALNRVYMDVAWDIHGRPHPRIVDMVRPPVYIPINCQWLRFKKVGRDDYRRISNDQLGLRPFERSTYNYLRRERSGTWGNTDKRRQESVVQRSHEYNE